MTRKSKKIRLDILVFESGLATSRHQAQGLILSGRVLVNDQPIDKPGTSVSVDSAIRLKGNPLKYVSRGGDKLEGALGHFGIIVDDLVVLDVGSSTGGFSDCLLQNGAKKVYAVDVGYNQLAHKLRVDPRVVVMERQHAKDLTKEHFEELPNFVTADVSFIGLEKILPSVLAVCAKDCQILLLVKPQFELGPEEIAKGGVVKDEEKSLGAVRRISEFLAKFDYQVIGSQACVLRGYKKGNQEYFVYAKSR